MRTIVVEPAVLENSASLMETINVQYRECFGQLYQAVELLSAGWQGADNAAFVHQIHGYQDDFQKISLLLSQYIEFLRAAARAYRQTQSELVSQASRLTN